MRSEVVRVKRDMGGSLWRESVEGWSVILGHMTPEIPVGETKSVRISVEIVEEREEEKVGSKAKWFIRKKQGESYDLVSLQCRGETWSDDWAYVSLKEICKDLPYGNHPVESIDFINGKIKFIETPRERLKREFNAASILDAQSLPNLYTAVNEFLAATEEAEKKGGG